MDIAILLFNGMTALDAVGPYGVLVRLPGAAVTFVAEEPGFVTDDAGRLALGAGTAIGDIPQPEVVVVPGGPGQTALMENRSVLSWLEDAHATTRWTTSVCTGSLVLGAAGILDGKRATSHWLALDQLTRHGAVPVPERVVVDGKVMTAAGVSAGIDLALRLAAELAGAKTAEAIQLGLEYDPQPPFGAGSPGTAPPAVVSALRARSRFLLEG